MIETLWNLVLVQLNYLRNKKLFFKAKMFLMCLFLIFLMQKYETNLRIEAVYLWSRCTYSMFKYHYYVYLWQALDIRLLVIKLSGQHFSKHWHWAQNRDSHDATLQCSTTWTQCSTAGFRDEELLILKTLKAHLIGEKKTKNSVWEYKLFTEYKWLSFLIWHHCWCQIINNSSSFNWIAFFVYSAHIDLPHFLIITWLNNDEKSWCFIRNKFK